jgi:alkylhydroperoxidase family enzyme
MSDDAAPVPNATGIMTGGGLGRTLGEVPRSARWILPAAAAAFGGTETSAIGQRERALLILRVASIERSPYWRTQIEGVAGDLGLTEDEITLVESDEWETAPAFDDRERAAILWGDRVARRLARRDRKAYEEVRTIFDEDAFVELTMIASLAAMHARIANALRIVPEPPTRLAPRARPIADDVFRAWNASMFDDHAHKEIAS